MELWLIRHPPVALAPGICYGASDVPLAQDAGAAAAALRAHLPDEFELHTSPLSRCRLLAQALHGAPRVDARLAEMDFGQWEGRSFEDIGREAVERWAADPWGYCPPGGECGAQLVRRVSDWAAQFESAGVQRTVVVSHGGPLRVLLGRWLEVPHGLWLAMRIDYGAVARLAFAQGRARLVSAQGMSVPR